MLREFFIRLLVAVFPAAACAHEECVPEMFVRRHGDNLCVSAKMDEAHDIVYWFRPCMANELYTFYRVGMSRSTALGPTARPETEPEIILNLAYSDNIGPFAIAGHGWCGGNHRYRERTAPTAFNESYAIFIDGRPLDDDFEGWSESVTVVASNIILDPSRPVRGADGTEFLQDTLCRETVTYRIYRNNIELAVHHSFLNRCALTVAAYYGMQSMFDGETHTFTPAGGGYGDWTPQAEVSSFTKAEHPFFRRFVERNEGAFQAAFLLPDGLGGHGELADSDLVFIGNSHGKSYHKLIADKTVSHGDESCWRGVYTWFGSPLADDSDLFVYEGTVEGRRALFVDCKKRCKRSIPFHPCCASRCEIIDRYGDIDVSVDGDRLTVSAAGPAGCVITMH